MEKSQNCNDSIAVETFQKSLNRDIPLYDSLTKTEPKTMIEAMSWTAKYIKHKKDQRLKKSEKSKHVKKGSL